MDEGFALSMNSSTFTFHSLELQVGRVYLQMMTNIYWQILTNPKAKDGTSPLVNFFCAIR